ncbi:MAG: division/cell wall cluster transcriptional repressor MraZ [Candidatus Omnitrophica bacterium]|nr:division/cell wall cluster transcriptional repressor MraZ [Candidatus Omnitrophota bacterium]
MFYGEYEHSIDKKGRLIVPARFREIFKERYSEKFYVTRGLDRCLFLFAEDDWKQQEKKFKELPFTREEARKFNRLYFSGACEVICDVQGRILVPQYLLDYAGIQEEVMIVGVSDRVEIWSKAKWQQFFGSSIDSFETLAEKLLDDKKN